MITAIKKHIMKPCGNSLWVFNQNAVTIYEKQQISLKFEEISIYEENFRSERRNLSHCRQKKGKKTKTFIPFARAPASPKKQVSFILERKIFSKWDVLRLGILCGLWNSPVYRLFHLLLHRKTLSDPIFQKHSFAATALKYKVKNKALAFL